MYVLEVLGYNDMLCARHICHYTRYSLVTHMALYPYSNNCSKLVIKLEMWANAQRDGHPAKHRWRPLFNAAKFG